MVNHTKFQRLFLLIWVCVFSYNISRTYLILICDISDGGSNLVIQQDTVFVSGMNPDCNEDEIAQHFGSIGVIKVSDSQCIFICRIAPCVWKLNSKYFFMSCYINARFCFSNCAYSLFELSYLLHIIPSNL